MMRMGRWKASFLAVCGGVLCACAAGGPGKAPAVTLIENGQSAYRIVVPERAAPFMGDSLSRAARLLSETLAEGYGAKLPVIREKELPRGAPAIFLGDTEFARRHGIDATKMKEWEERVKMIEGNLVIAGRDWAVTSRPKWFSHFVQSTFRAVTLFLREYAGVKFLLPGENGIYVPRGKKLELACDLDRTYASRFQYCRCRYPEPAFALANGLLPSGGTWLYGGHSYYRAVPAKKYAATHPEYFIQAGGGRSPHDNHLCLSNPEVQELIYQEMLRKLDAGYETVELGQTDACQKCECARCHKLFGAEDLGEQLWILHRKLAERLYKERPDKKVMIISYGPTGKPPKTFKEFPPNTAIELCASGETDLESWSQVKAPQGLTAYLYNWGDYHTVGVSSPKRTAEYLEKQQRRFRKHHVRAIFLCGFGELYGLEGPAYYAFCRLMENPDCSGTEAIHEFCRYAYQEAEAPMRGFFDLIDKRLKLNPDNDYEFTDPGRKTTSPQGEIPRIWDPPTLAVLERSLTTAEKLARSPKVKARLKLVRSEFDFLVSTVRALSFYNVYRLNPTWDNLRQLEKEVEVRRGLLARLYARGAGAARLPGSRAARLPGWEAVPLFGGCSRADAEQNGRSHGRIGAPFNWNFKLLREKKILPCSSVPRIHVPRAATEPSGFDFESGAWSAAQWNVMNGIQLGEASVPTRFKVLYSDQNLYVAFEGERGGGKKYRSMGKDGHCWGQDCFEIMLDPFGLRERHYHFISNAAENSYYDDRAGFITDPLAPDRNAPEPSWNGKWSYRYQLTDTEWRQLFIIPLSNFPVAAPAKGTIWTANFGREEFKPGARTPELLLWAPNPEARDFGDRDKFGELIFE